MRGFPAGDLMYFPFLRKDGDLTLPSLNAPNFGIRYRFCRLWTRPHEAQARMGLDSQPFSWSARTGRLYSWSATYGRFRMGKSSKQIRRRSACTDSLWADRDGRRVMRGVHIQ